LQATGGATVARDPPGTIGATVERFGAEYLSPKRSGVGRFGYRVTA